MRRVLAALAVALCGVAMGSDARRNEPTTAVARVARDVAAQAIAAGAESPIAVHVTAGTAELARGFAAALGAELVRAKQSMLVVEGTVPDAERDARAAGGRTLLRVAISVDRGLLSVRGDLFRIRPNFWSGASAARTGIAAAIATSTEADAHALALGAPLLEPPNAGKSPLLLSPNVLAALPSPTAALAAGDLDGDGKDELVALTDDELIVLGPTGTVIARQSLRELGPSATPCREPFGALAIQRGTPARIALFSGRHGRGQWLELVGQELRARPLERPVLTAGVTPTEGTWVPGQNVFLLDRPRGADLPPVTSTSAFVSATGAQLLAVHPDGAGTWLWLDGSRAPVTLAGLGAGTALVDLDGDGTPELATSSTEYLPQPDLVKLTDSAQQLLWQVPLERGRILQLVPADLDGDCRPELIVGAWLPDGTSELRVLRRAGP